MAVLGKHLIVHKHQLALANGGRGLLAGGILWLFFQAQLAHADANGAGCHQHHLLAAVHDIAEHPHQALHLADVGAAARVRQRGGAYLDHDAAFAVRHVFLLLMSGEAVEARKDGTPFPYRFPRPQAALPYSFPIASLTLPPSS